MIEHDALIDSFEHLYKEKREKDALHILHKIASLVKPIMRNHSWRIGTLAEFYPDQDRLLGLNINKGQKICLRLRYPGDKQQFLPLEAIVDTMLHELTHNVHGPHDDHFKALNNELRKEYDGLISKGYTGEGFLGKGQVLGGRRLPVNEMRRQARVQAEKRRNHLRGAGQRLGSDRANANGRNPAPASPRQAAALAAIKRASANDKCASHGNEARKIAERSSKESRRTHAKDTRLDDDTLRQQALWDLVRQEEAGKAGVQDWNDEEEEGLGWDPESGLTLVQRTAPSGFDSSSDKKDTTRATNRPHSHLPDSASDSFRNTQQPKSKVAEPSTWDCPICTLANPIKFLCCDACGIERPQYISDEASSSPSPERGHRNSTSQDRTSRNTNARSPSNVAQPTATQPRMAKAKSMGWNCSRCGTFMEHKWWTCSGCGRMKDSSAS